MTTKESMNVGTRDFDSDIRWIINDMSIKRNIFRDMNTNEIHQKLFSDNPQKLGEYLEFMEEYKVSENRLTPDLALKIADIVYYTSQPNCSEQDRILATKLEKMIGIDHKLAQQFCILKYFHRAYEQQEGDDYKKIERELMVNFLNNRNLRNLE